MFQSDVRLSRDRWIAVSATVIFRVTHAPSHVNFGASPKFLEMKEVVGEGADHSTRGACAPRISLALA